MRIRRETLETFSPGAREVRHRCDSHAHRIASFTNPAIVEAVRSVNSANEEVDARRTARPTPRRRGSIEWLESRGTSGVRSGQLQACATGSSPASGTGASPSRSCTTHDGNYWPVSESASAGHVLPDLADYEPVESDEPVPLLAKATEWDADHRRRGGRGSRAPSARDAGHVARRTRCRAGPDHAGTTCASVIRDNDATVHLPKAAESLLAALRPQQ